MLKADCLKFVITFRSQLPRETTLALFSSIVQLLGAESNVVHSYAATCLERALALKENGKPRFTKQEVLPFAQGRFRASLHDGDARERGERVSRQVLHEDRELLRPRDGRHRCGVHEACLRQARARVPQPHQLELQPLHVRDGRRAHQGRGGGGQTKQLLPEFERSLFPVFQVVLVEDLEDFAPYVFQVLSQLIEVYDPPLPDVYTQIFPPLLNPTMWERSGNVPRSSGCSRPT